MLRTSNPNLLPARWRRGFAFVLAIVALLVALAQRIPAAGDGESTSLTVSAAISLKDALDELGPLYEKQHPGIGVTFNYGGSGTLQHQVEQGAPVDVFFSAAEKQMNQLESEGLLLAGTRSNVLQNSLVLIAPAASSSVRSFQDLESPTVRTIALGKPSTVPAGMYATQTLEHLGLLTNLRKKLVYAKDVRAVLVYVETGNADAGFVYRTDAMTSTKVRVVTIAPASSHDPIVYPAAVLKASQHPQAATALLRYFESPGAQRVFLHFGFLPAENSAGKS
ncbi:MAG TPA: molybdate ABC transporter substrate-binding protein [Candidatus Acidoferrum sp.]|nr:molybdate ABC transporter substrate-binding protein [Candidatus Acidoferrum sp.]